MIGISWGGFNAPAGRDPPAAGPEGDHHHRLHRRPLSPTTSTTRAAACCSRISAGLAPCSPTPRARPIPRWSAPALARHVDRAPQERAAAARTLAPAPASRRTTGSMARSARTTVGDRGRHARRRRLGRRLQERRAPARCQASEGAGEGPGRALAAQISRISPCPAPPSASSRRPCAGGTSSLKGKDTGVEKDPAYVAYMQDSVPPQALLQGARRPLDRRGQMAVEDASSREVFKLNRGALDKRAAARGQAHAHARRRPPASPPASTARSGSAPKPPVDQRLDDGGSLLFDTAPLPPTSRSSARPRSSWTSSRRQPAGQPRRAALRRLSRRRGDARDLWRPQPLPPRRAHEKPSPLKPGKTLPVRVPIDDVAYRFPEGPPHPRSRSPPLLAADLAVAGTGDADAVLRAKSELSLPVRPGNAEKLRPFPEPEGARR